MATRQNNSTAFDAADSEALKRYLFYEASEAERRALEEKFFESDELFYELLDLENDLTDCFARGELVESDRARFQKSLEKSPDRRAKLASAKTLQALINEETKASAPVKIEETTNGLWERIRRLLDFSAPRFRYAAAAFLILLFAGIGFLIYERQRDARELARLREIENQRSAEIERQETALREQIKTIQEREQTLQTELAAQRGQTEILTEQLEKEQAEKTRLTRDLEILKQRQTDRPPEIQPPAPVIATVILAPVGGKGGGDAAAVTINQNTRVVAATLQIPKDSAAETFSVSLNSAPLAANLKLNRTASGNKFIRVNLPAKNLSSENENTLTVSAADGSRYNYVLRRK